MRWAAAGASLVGCKVVKAVDTPQSIANNTGTVITWTVESFDTDGFHSNDTNTGRLTIPSGKGGKYLVNANYFWQTNGTGLRLHEILLNGGSYARANFPAISNENNCCTITTIGTFVAGDYLEAYVKQTSSGSLNFSELYTSFSCIYLGA